jgi:hypothetical protein
MPLFVNGTNSPFATGTNPVSIATADLNGDGHLDLLTSNYISDNVSVLFGNGHGVFTPQPAVPVGNGPREVEAGDLDGDGDIDFVTSNYAANSISVLRNNGNGTFAAAVDVPTGGLVARSVALADLDGDGDLDAVTANYNSNNVSVLLNNGSGVFAAAAGSPIAVGTRPVHVVLADFNGDHRRDIAVWTTGWRRIRRWALRLAAPAPTGVSPMRSAPDVATSFKAGFTAPSAGARPTCRPRLLIRRIGCRRIAS